MREGRLLICSFAGWEGNGKGGSVAFILVGGMTVVSLSFIIG